MDCVMLGVASPMTADVHGVLQRLGWSVRAFVNGVDATAPPDGPPWTSIDEVDPHLLRLPVVIPIFTPGHRLAALGQATDAGFDEIATVVDPTAVIAPGTNPDRGVLVNAGAIVAAGGRIGEFAHLNRGANVGHDATIEAFASLAPGCVLTGGVHVGRGAFIGAGAVINPDVRIGTNAVVGAGAVVIRDVEPQTIVVGNPAAVVRTAIAGYKDLAV